jgi:hypothetical protein
MAATDLIKVQKVYTDPVTSTTTLGLEEKLTLVEMLASAGTGATVVGQSTAVVTQTAPAAAPVPFADLTAAANYVNSLRTLLIAARVLK